MARPGIDGAERKKGHFFTSQAFQTGFLSRNKCSSSTQVMNVNKKPHDIPGELEDTKKDTLPNFRSIFTRKKPENTEISFFTETLPNPKDVSQKFGGKTSFPRSMSLRGNFSSKDLSEQVPSVQNSTNRSQWNQTKSQTNKSSSKDPPSKCPKRLPADVVAWEPPPLFQAYPQALKYSHLPALSLSTDIILRIDGNRKASLARGEPANVHDEIEQGQINIQEPTTCHEKLANSSLNCRHRRQPSNNFTKEEWVKKVFVLLASGYLLQYSGSGTYDRLPERVMRLGKDSVAFASDVIPGKHWVLQVSQSMNSDGVPAVADSRSFFSRLTNRACENKKAVTSFLLVLKSAEELESWITTLRIEISRLKGENVAAESLRHKGVDKPLPPLRKQISFPQDTTHSYKSGSQLKRLPTGIDSGAKRNPEPHSTVIDGNSILLPRQRTPTHETSTGYHSMTNSFVSQDGKKLESLSGSQNRFSYISTSQRTIVTPQSLSPNVSPVLVAFDDFNRTATNNDSRLKPIPAGKTEHRVSMHSAHSPGLHPQDSKMNFRKSCGSSSRSHSPTPVTSLRGLQCGSKSSKIEATSSAILSLPNCRFVEKSSASSSPTTRPHSYIDISPQTTILPHSNSNDSRNLKLVPINDTGISQRENIQANCQIHGVANINSNIIRDTTPLPINISSISHSLKAISKDSERKPKVDSFRAGSRVGIENSSTASPYILSRPLTTYSLFNQAPANNCGLDDQDIVIIKPSRKINQRSLSHESKMRRVSSPGESSIANSNSNHIADQLASQPYSYVPSSKHVHSSSSYYSKVPLPTYRRPPPNCNTSQILRSLSSTEIESTKIKSQNVDQSKNCSILDLKLKPSQVNRNLNAGPQHRRSLPSLVSGPPPLPPPNCALPPLPPAGLTKKTKIDFNIMKEPKRNASGACS